MGRTIGRKFGTLQQSNGIFPQNEIVSHYSLAFLFLLLLYYILRLPHSLTHSLSLCLSISLSLSVFMVYQDSLGDAKHFSFIALLLYYFNWFSCLFWWTANNCRGSGGSLYWLDKANRNVNVAVGTDMLRPSAINKRVETREIARE